MTFVRHRLGETAIRRDIRNRRRTGSLVLLRCSVNPSHLQGRNSGLRTQETTLSVSDLVASTVSVVVVEAITPALLDVATTISGQVVASTALRHRSLSISSTVFGKSALCCERD